MEIKNLHDYKYGFITGTLFQNDINNDNNSVAVQRYKKNQIMAFWYRKIDTEYYVVINGKVSVDGAVYGKDSVIIYGPTDVRKMIFLEDTDLLVIRIPGTTGDYYNYSDATEDELKRFISDYYREHMKNEITGRINLSELTVLVQGGVSDLTSRSLRSVRKYLPGAKIVLSTWNNSNIDGLEYDELVLSDDPGASSVLYNGKTYYNNLNRQLVGIKNGLKTVKTKYCLKMRSDSILIGDGILNCFQLLDKRQEEFQFFDKRVVIGETFNTLCRSLDGVTIPMPFNISDWFYFGLSDDIKKLFDIDLQSEEEAINWKWKKEMPYNHYMKLDWIYHWRYDCEQFILVNALKKKFDIPYYDISDYTEDNIRLSKDIILNNFTIVTVPMHQIINLKYIEDTLEGVNCADGEMRYGYEELCSDYKQKFM